MKFIIGKKITMSQRYDEHNVVPVTVIAAGPCTVTQIKTAARDGYASIQIGFDPTAKKLAKPQQGHLKNLGAFRYLKEFRVESAEIEKSGVQRGSMISVDQFKPGEKIQVSGISKGRGFQGVVKRHGFSGSPKTHGHKDQLRMPGSIGAGGVQRVLKGTRMAGRMGGDRVTVKSLEIVEVDPVSNLLYLKGAVPGARNSILLLVSGGDLVTTQNAANRADTESVRLVDAPNSERAPADETLKAE